VTCEFAAAHYGNKPDAIHFEQQGSLDIPKRNDFPEINVIIWFTAKKLPKCS
jgi:hypothetical protein